jgi:hypothetical protein
MSGIAEPPVQPAAPAEAPRHVPRGGLPESATLKPVGPSTDVLFSAHQVENGKEVPKAPANLTPPPATPPVVPIDTNPPVSPLPGTDHKPDLASQFIPEGAKAPKEVAAPAPASTNPEDNVVLDKSYTPKAHESFAQVKAITKDLRSQLQKANDDLAAAKADAEKLRSGTVVTDSAEIATLRTEHEAMSKRLMISDLQEHPKFKQEFVAPRQQAVADARTILEAAGVSGVDVESLLSKDPVAFRKSVSEIAEKIPLALDKSDFANAARMAYGIKQRGDGAIAKAGEINQALRTQQFNGHKTAFDTTFASTIGSLTGVKELVAPVDATPEQRAKVDAFNNGFKAIRADAEKIALAASSPEDISRSAIKAAAYEWQAKQVLPMMSELIASGKSRIAELEAQIADIRRRNPNAQLRGSDTSGSGVDPTKMNHHDAAEYFATKRSA